MSEPPPNPAILQLESVLGNEATREIVRLFLEEFPRSMLQLGTCPPDDQKRIVHGLRSSSGLMGAAALAERMAKLERVIGASAARLGAEDLAAAQADFDAAAPELRAYAGS